MSSVSKAGAYAGCGLGTIPRGGCHPSCMPQVASPQEGYATIYMRYSPQGVPGGRS